jgi:hypothetical protein
MTGVDMPAFVEALKRTGAIFSKPVDGELTEGYHLALADIPLPIIEAGLLRCQRGSKFFPRPAQIREACDAVKSGMGHVAGPPVHHEDGQVWCARCSDTGWEHHECSGAGRCHRCHAAKMSVGYDHRYVTACECRGRNPVYQANHQRPANFHQEVA